MSTLATLKARAVRSLAALFDDVEPAHRFVPGTLGDAVGIVDVPGRTGYVYVRLLGDSARTVRARNMGIPATADASVWVELMGNPGDRVTYRIPTIENVDRVYSGSIILGEGLTVNNDSGSSTDSDLTVKTDTLIAIFVDASAETLEIGVPTTLLNGLKIDTSLETSGGRVVNTTRVTTTYTALVTDDTIYCDTDGGAWTLTLPVGVDGQRFFITNCGTSGNDLTIDGNGAETINGELTQLLSDEDSVIIIWETTENWRVF